MPLRAARAPFGFEGGDVRQVGPIRGGGQGDPDPDTQPAATAALRPNRPLPRSRLSAVGRFGGRLAVAGIFTVGPVPRGASTQVLYRLAPGDCTRRQPRISGYPAPLRGQVLVPRRARP
jgi:hypothetical protein